MIYEGEWKNGMKQGKGTMILNDHRLFSCKWILNCPLLLLFLGFIIVIVLIILLIVGIINIKNAITQQNVIKYCTDYYSNSSLIIESNHCNEEYISSFFPKPSLEYIDIGDGCFENVKIVMIDGLNKLKSLKIGRNSFTKRKNGEVANTPSRSFSILNCATLESIEIGHHSFSDYGGGFELYNLPKLSTIKIGEIGLNSNNFYYSSFVIKGMIDMI